MAEQTHYYDQLTSHLFKRCLQCPSDAPSCPQCSSDEVCTTTIGDCYSCSSAKCVKTVLSGSTNASNTLSSSGPNVGAIVGGVVAGIVVIIVAAYCIWKYGMKGKRVKLPPEAYEWDEDLPEEKAGSVAFGQLRHARESTHTVNSLASTVLTRASNVIQIAYIPGITQRSPDSAGGLTPPVPPIPMPTTGHNGDQQQSLFFVPQLRNSQWSDSSSMMTSDYRKSVTSSLARSSIGTTIYQNNALANPMPAMPMMGKINVVSVKSAGGSAATTPQDSPASQNGEFLAHKASVATSASAASRPVIVKMLGANDALKTKNTLPAVSTAKSMKPVALNITKKGSAGGTTTPSSASIEGGAAGTSPSTSTLTTSPATTLVNTPDRLGLPRPPRPQTSLSMAESIDTTAPHSRNRFSIAHSHRTIGIDGDSSDDDDDHTHQRSRASLLTVRGVRGGPFSDDAEVNSPVIPQNQRRSPFGDDNAF